MDTAWIHTPEVARASTAQEAPPLIQSRRYLPVRSAR